MPSTRTSSRLSRVTELKMHIASGVNVQNGEERIGGRGLRGVRLIDMELGNALVDLVVLRRVA